MQILRTPDERFISLSQYPFKSKYIEVNDLRMHYLDEGQSENETVLFLHGEPSWSYLYRKMIPLITNAGYRAVAPDLIGFGKSDKPIDREAYTYQKHVDWMADFIQQLDLRNITLFGQDWGGLIGLRIAAEHQARFKRIVAANTFLPTGDQKPPEAFFKWREYSQKTETFNIGRIVKSACVSELSPQVIAAYDAPFPNESYKAGARQFPRLVPVTPDDPASAANRKAWDVLRNWHKPFLTAFSDSDRITRGGDIYFQKYVPGAKGQKHTIIENAGHFLQEDKGEELARIVVDFIKEN